MLKLIDSAWIGSHFACPLAYGDTTCITDEESAALDRWVSQRTNATFSITDDTDEFRKCGVTGLWGNCVRVDIYEESPRHR